MSLLVSVLVLFWTNIFIVNCQFTDYKKLSNIKLPKRLALHYTVIYNSKIYVFGGYHVNSLNKAVLNEEWHTLDISEWNLSLNDDKTDIKSQPAASNWTLIQAPSAPNYGQGAAQHGTLACYASKCSVLIGNLLYIVTPGVSNQETNGEWMYILDLSRNPIEFVDSTSFESTLPHNFGDACVTTDGTDVYYIKQLYRDSPHLFYKYNVAEDKHEQLRYLTKDRTGISCLFNYDNSRLYTLGGDNVDNPTVIDWYVLSDNSWTDNVYGANDGQYDFPIHSDSLSVPQCIQNPFRTIIECVGGNGNAVLSNNTYYFSTTLNKLIYNSTNGGVASMWNSQMIYTIYDTSQNGAVLYLLSGGLPYPYVDTIWYAVRYGDKTQQPTTAQPSMSPTKTPSISPTKATISPTKQPSISPTKATISPTKQPSNGPTISPSMKPSSAPTKNTNNAYYNEGKILFTTIIIMIIIISCM